MNDGDHYRRIRFRRHCRGTVREIIEANRYLVLATADASGRPWISPDHRIPAPLT